MDGWNNAGGNQGDCSAIVKIVRPDPARNDPSHYNYWRREALAYQSEVLRNMPTAIHAPTCYEIEEKPDGSIWLWLEHVQAGPQCWQEAEFAFAAYKLGQFQARYLQDEPLPNPSWLNRAWLQSWVHECRKYQPWPERQIVRMSVTDSRIARIAERFDEVYPQFDKWIEAVNRLPRVFAHQDYYENNLFIAPDQKGESEKLIVIDWQFASISGIGEDLGRFYGLSISRGSVPIERFHAYRQLLWESYLRGMYKADWNGDERLVRLGFLISSAIRSVWEVPKLMEKAAQRELVHESGYVPENPAIERLIRVCEVHMEMAEEAQQLLKKLSAIGSI